MKFIEIKDVENYGLWMLEYSSSGEEYRPNNNAITISTNSKYITISLPNIIKPMKHLHTFIATWKDGNPKRSYYEYFPKEYGICYSMGDHYFSIDYGIQTGRWSSCNEDGLNNRTKGWFIPWLEKRHVEHYICDLDGNMISPNFSKASSYDWKEENDFEKVKYKIKDFDGEEIVATCNREFRKWKHGTGLFKWLSYFVDDLNRDYLEIEFSSEVGRRKGSWKGGTIGHSTDILEGETATDAFERYCGENELEMVIDK